MRPKGRQHGRFVALSGLKKLPGAPGSRYRLIIIESSGLPVFHVTEWYRRKKTSDPGRTPDTYLDMLLPFIGFQLRHDYAWNAAPDRIRTHLVEFLHSEIHCQVVPDREYDGYFVETTGGSPLSKSSLGVFLAALANLYDVMIDGGYYSYPNPLRSEHLVTIKHAHLQTLQNAGAPDLAGIRSETHYESQRYPTGYFRQRKGKVWEPEIVMEPDTVQQHMRDALDFMIRYAPLQ